MNPLKTILRAGSGRGSGRKATKMTIGSMLLAAVARGVVRFELPLRQRGVLCHPRIPIRMLRHADILAPHDGLSSDEPIRIRSRGTEATDPIYTNTSQASKAGTARAHWSTSKKQIPYIFLHFPLRQCQQVRLADQATSQHAPPSPQLSHACTSVHRRNRKATT